MLKKIRIGFWLVVLMVVIFQLWQDYRLLHWKKPLYVAIYPVNADKTPAVDAYIRQLRTTDFSAVEDFLSAQARLYQLQIQRPVILRLGPSIMEAPPALPSGHMYLWDIVRWSLQFRWYAWTHQPDVAYPVDIKLYLLYFDLERHQILAHSTALSKGRIGLVNLFAHASQHPMNQVVLAHELLHTVHATDKYDAKSHEPVFPHGYAEPYAQPLYPQSMAELMAGKVALAPGESRMAQDLTEVVIGRLTAKEIGWLP